jgi:hexosaminidase
LVNNKAHSNILFITFKFVEMNQACKNRFLLLLIFVYPFVAKSQNNINIIPWPQNVVQGEGFFTFKKATTIVYSLKDKGISIAVSPLISKLKKAAGVSLTTSQRANAENTISIELSNKITTPEGYELNVSTGKINIAAKNPVGVFYAIQSLLQLLPVEIESNKLVKNIDWKLPVVSIVDAPAFSYRGLMLDVARHYMPYEYIKKLIDLMAMQKMNTLHLHLTDSQGWRFESKKYPKLNSIGAYRKGTPFNTTYDYASRPADTLYGGYYTQQQLKELVRYASKQYVTIIPEIEMPAHSKSALAAYPNLACLDSTGAPFAYPSQVQDEYCTKDETFKFLTDILTEVMEVFPSKNIHIAGDEAGKANWRKCPVCQKRMREEKLATVEELQSYFIKRIEKFVNQKGRTVIGWDEILEGGLAPNAIVMSWRGEEGGIEAAKQNHKVVMTPGSYCYFDHYQSEDASEPPAFGGLTTLSKVFSYQPIPSALTEAQGKLVMGAQGNLWTESVATAQHSEYMYFPRAVALAEVTWSTSKQVYAHFLNRLLSYLQRLDYYNVNYSRHLFEIKIKTFIDPATGQLMANVEGVPNGFNVFYTTDGSTPTNNSMAYVKPVPVENKNILTVGVIYKGLLVDKAQKYFSMNKATGQPSALATPPNKSYNSGGEHAWNNGILGNDGRFNDDEWLGWSGQDFEGTIDLQKPTTINKVSARFFNKPNSWVYIPSAVTIFTSDDGVNFKELMSKNNFDVLKDGVQKVSFESLNITARYLKVIARNYGAIPKGNPGEGSPAWLFADEVTVE